MGAKKLAPKKGVGAREDWMARAAASGRGLLIDWGETGAVSRPGAYERAPRALCTDLGAMWVVVGPDPRRKQGRERRRHARRAALLSPCSASCSSATASSPVQALSRRRGADLILSRTSPRPRRACPSARRRTVSSRLGPRSAENAAGEPSSSPRRPHSKNLPRRRPHNFRWQFTFLLGKIDGTDTTSSI